MNILSKIALLSMTNYLTIAILLLALSLVIVIVLNLYISKLNKHITAIEIDNLNLNAELTSQHLLNIPIENKYIDTSYNEIEELIAMHMPLKYMGAKNKSMPLKLSNNAMQAVIANLSVAVNNHIVIKNQRLQASIANI